MTDTVTIANRPMTRQRTHKQPPTLAVPDIDEDAAERKRVLNVLAQRRYREKKRLSRLKASTAQSVPEEVVEIEPETETSLSSTTEKLLSVSSTSSVVYGALPSPPNSLGSGHAQDINFSLRNPLDDAAFESMLPDVDTLPDFLTVDEGSGNQGFLQTSFAMMGPSLAETFTTINPLSLSSASNVSSDPNVPGSYHLPVHELTLLRALLCIVDRIGCKGELWSLDCPSPFISGMATPSDQLPASWRPTTSQIAIPHHPLLDVLPWPGVRDKLIKIFTLPDEMRPSHAAGPLGMVNFAYDVKDNSEGVRIYGEDCYDPSQREVGQVLFERWWFLFDRGIIETSNRWRRLRGAPPLLLKGSDSPRLSTGTTGAFPSTS